jgi:hypothetical protein
LIFIKHSESFTDIGLQLYSVVNDKLQSFFFFSAARFLLVMAPYFLARSDSADAGPIPISKTVYIVGFTLAGFFLALAASWVALRFFRRKLQEKRAEARGAAFLNVRGVVREMDEPVNFSLR